MAGDVTMVYSMIIYKGIFMINLLLIPPSLLLGSSRKRGWWQLPPWAFHLFYPTHRRSPWFVPPTACGQESSEWVRALVHWGLLVPGRSIPARRSCISCHGKTPSAGRWGASCEGHSKEGVKSRMSPPAPQTSGFCFSSSLSFLFFIFLWRTPII